MLKELMANIGIGSAKVYLELTNPKAEIGGTLEGVIKVKGGSVEQVVDRVYVNLVLTSSYGTGTHMKHVNKTVATHTAADRMVLRPERELTIPVQFKIPHNIPISKGRTKYYLVTGLAIEQALDPKESKPVMILPNSYMKMVFDAFSMLGFEEKAGFGDFNRMFQEFEYRPTKFMAEEIGEVEIFPSTGEREISIALYITKRAWGSFGNIMTDRETDHQLKRFSLPYDEIISSSQLANKLRDIIKLEYTGCC